MEKVDYYGVAALLKSGIMRDLEQATFVLGEKLGRRKLGMSSRLFTELYYSWRGRKETAARVQNVVGFSKSSLKGCSRCPAISLGKLNLSLFPSAGCNTVPTHRGYCSV